MTVTRDDIVALARQWLGTPYHHQASRKGVGCDCLGLVRGVWRELFGSEPEQPEPYSADWAEATGTEAMLLAARRHFNERALEDLRPGDVVVFRIRTGRMAKHAAVVSAPGHMIHAQEGVPVSEVPISHWWRRRIAGVFAFPGVSD
jgi:NlpC/P60 family putative phage cell wall peptidase